MYEPEIFSDGTRGFHNIFEDLTKVIGTTQNNQKALTMVDFNNESVKTCERPCYLCRCNHSGQTLGAEMVRVPRHAFDKMILLGKNYLEHAKELGDKVPPKPVLFMKPPSSAVVAGAQHDTVQARLPKNRGVVHYETELLLRLNDDLEIDAVSLGMDLTLRDLQADLKTNGWPWEIGKVFKDSAIIGPWIDIKQFPDYMEKEFVLKLDGATVQHAKGNEMSMKPEEALAYIKEHFPLCSGDVVFTGTPAGVGPVNDGQLAELTWGDKLEYKVQF